MFLAALGGIAALPCPAAAATGPGDTPAIDVPLACVRGANDDGPEGASGCGPGHAGIAAWLAEVRRRTSVAAAAAPRPFAWRDGPPTTPLVLWTGSARMPPLGAEERRNLRRFLQAGGTLFVDTEDGRTDGPFVGAVRRELEAIYGADALAPIDARHVLYRSFYLAHPPRGLAAAPAPPDGLRLQGRLAAVLLQHDLFGALAARLRADEPPVREQDDRDAEADLRFAINWLMYALCGDYKDDHVHLPTILKRRG